VVVVAVVVVVVVVVAVVPQVLLDDAVRESRPSWVGILGSLVCCHRLVTRWGIFLAVRYTHSKCLDTMLHARASCH